MKILWQKNKKNLTEEKNCDRKSFLNDGMNFYNADQNDRVFSE